MAPVLLANVTEISEVTAKAISLGKGNLTIRFLPILTSIYQLSKVLKSLV